MQARIIAVASRRVQAQEAARVLSAKGWNAQVHQGFNYWQTLNRDGWQRQLKRFKQSGFFVSAHNGFSEFTSACCARSHVDLWKAFNEPLLVCEDDVNAEFIPSPREVEMRDEFVMFDARWLRYQPTCSLWRMWKFGCGLNAYLIDPVKVRAKLPLHGIREHIDWHILEHNDRDVVKAWVSNRSVPNLSIPSTRESTHCVHG